MDVINDCVFLSALPAFSLCSVKTCQRIVINISVTVFQLGWEKGRVQKKLGTLSVTIQHANETRSGHNFVGDR